MSNDELVIRAKDFGHSRQILIDFGNPLGAGQEGFVWKTNRETAVKVFDRFHYPQGSEKDLNYLFEQFSPIACLREA